MYLRPVYIVHPLYEPKLACCPQCRSENIGWEGWTGHGHREVHGLHCEETAIGFQLICKDCKAAKPTGVKDFKFTWATTNAEYWDKRDFWEIPRKCNPPLVFNRDKETE